MWARRVHAEFSPQLVNLHLIIHKTETSAFAYNGDMGGGESTMNEKVMKSTCLCMHEKERNRKKQEGTHEEL